ncbi:9934_t:CDS:2 [Dentiscutata erythropus]|uniref:9934_t:CDS:1 n=1 Tax=Dentiscutata erythropus TaxID=1348616 RepID=A0A9N8VXW2_9GLOM|nr:9934_t:CDS:2 [Dentiscutata erythropus]
MSSMINCFWSLLSLKDLSFVYVSPWLSKALGPDHDLLLGASVFDYFHPQDRELARRDLSECRYNNVPAIRKRLQSQTTTSSNKGFPPSKLSTYQDDDNDYIIMHLGMNVVSQDIVLACFHPDDGNYHFSKKDLNKLSSLLRKHSTAGFSKVQTPPATPFPENKSFFGGSNSSPNRIFQILDRNSRSLIFSWPDPSFVPGFDLSYDKDEFSRLLQNSSINPNNFINGKDRIDVHSPNCLRLISNKHTIISSGKSQQVESVMIPYGIIIFACFQVSPSTSTISFSSPPFKPQKSLSAPCSPPTINGNSKRPRSPNSSPGSLSPTYYSDSGSNKSCSYNSGHPYPYRQEISEFVSSKRIRPNNISPIPRPLINLTSPHNSPPVYQNQYPFPSMSHSQNDQKLPTISHQQIYFTQHNQQYNQQYNQQLSQQHPHIPVPNQTASFTQFTPSQRRNNTTINGTKKCESCHTSSSPEWRRGPTAREIRKREQAQREQEQRIREQREGEERARERAAAIMMQHVIEPHYNQYRPNTNITNSTAEPPSTNGLPSKVINIPVTC